MRETTAREAAAIRNADSLCFDGDSDGNGFIRAIIRADPNEAERTITVPVESNRVDNYGPGDGPWNCFDMIMSARYDDRVQTIVRQIKKGSRIALVWTRDNSSPITQEAGVVVDMLDIKVQNGNVCNTYRVSTRVTLDNSARMVRRA